MSCYMKFNSWTGDDTTEATARLAKMFRMDSGEADLAMKEIMDGQNWQFHRTISDEQAEVAQTYLKGQGFDLELVSEDAHSSGATAVPYTPAEVESPEKKSWLDFLKPKKSAKQKEAPAQVETNVEEGTPAKKSFFSFSFGKKKKTTEVEAENLLLSRKKLKPKSSPNPEHFLAFP